MLVGQALVGSWRVGNEKLCFKDGSLSSLTYLFLPAWRGYFLHERIILADLRRLNGGGRVDALVGYCCVTSHKAFICKDLFSLMVSVGQVFGDSQREKVWFEVSWVQMQA